MMNLEKDDVDFKRFDNQTDFVSVIVTYANPKHVDRLEFLEKCLASIHRYADYPFELILMDDTGLDLTTIDGSEVSEYVVKDKVSTLVLNMGKPLKQPTQINRGVKIASSKYIVVIEDDVEVTRPCFRGLSQVLDKPYIGYINSEGIDPVEYLKADKTDFVVGGRLGGSWFMAFRKDLWRKVGGFPEYSHATGPPFLQKTTKLGYWRGFLKGPRLARNMDVEDYESKKSTRMVGTTGYYPRLFNISDGRYDKLSEERHNMNLTNYNECRDVPGSVSNIEYWTEYCDLVTPDLRRACISSIDWKAAERHGQSEWKDMILSEEVYYA